MIYTKKNKNSDTVRWNLVFWKESNSKILQWIPSSIQINSKHFHFAEQFQWFQIRFLSEETKLEILTRMHIKCAAVSHRNIGIKPITSSLDSFESYEWWRHLVKVNKIKFWFASTATNYFLKKIQRYSAK